MYLTHMAQNAVFLHSLRRQELAPVPARVHPRRPLPRYIHSLGEWKLQDI